MKLIDFVIKSIVAIVFEDAKSTKISTSTKFISFVIVVLLLLSFVQLVVALLKNWKNTKNCYQELEDKYTVSKNENKCIVSVDPISYFRSNCSHPLIYSRLPNLMTSVGILGTFWGISDSLFTIDPNIYDVVTRVAPVILGMKTAFFTSLLGIIGSLLYLMSGIVAESFYKSFIFYPNFRRVKKTFEQESAAMYLRKQSSLSDGLAEAANTLVGVFGTIKETINPEVTANILRDAIRPSMESIDQKMDAFAEIKEINKDLKENNKKLGDFITQEMDGIFKSMENALDKTISTIETTNSSIIKTRDGLEDQMKTFSVLDGTLKELPNELKNMLSNVQVHLQHFSEEYQKGLTTYLDRQGDHLDKHLGKHADKLSDVVLSFSSAINQSNDEFQKTLQMQKKVGDRLFEIVKTSKEEEEFFKTAIQEASIQLDERLSKHTSIARSIENILTGSEKTFVKIDEKFSKIEGAINEDVISGITDFCHRQKDVIEKYQHQVDTHMAVILNQLLAFAGYIQEKKQDEVEGRSL